MTIRHIFERSDLFLMETWLEYLRQHQRITIAGEGFEATVKPDLRENLNPVVHHLLGAPTTVRHVEKANS
jgi:hypothetical protein